MTNFTTCPYCESELKVNELSLKSCPCGWFDKGAERQVRQKTELKAAKTLFGTVIVLGLLIAHIMNWGTHAATIPVTRLLQVTHLLSVEGYKELATMCFSQAKYSCAENAYDQAFTKSKDPSYLLSLANLQLRQKKTHDATATFGRYFAAKGTDGDAMLAYAKLLERANLDRDAVRYFKASIKARPEIVPVQATAGIVRILMKQKKYGEVKAVIVSFQKSSIVARDYLISDLDKVERLINPVIKRSIASH